jgi:hypothetical protein
MAFGATVYLGLRWFRAKDNKVFAWYLMHDYAYSAQGQGANPPDLEARMAEFRATIRAALTGGGRRGSGRRPFLGGASGRVDPGRPDPRGPAGGGPALSFLSLGHVVPMVSFLPKAQRLRADLAYLSARPQTDLGRCHRPRRWLRLCALRSGGGVRRGPGQALAAGGVGGLQPDPVARPLARAARRYFRLHFQYLCAFDRPGDYDYFRITAGPQTLADRAYAATGPVKKPHRHAGEPLYKRGTAPMIPPKPAARGPTGSRCWRYLRLFRRDILSAQPARLYRAWMAEFRTPFFRSYCATTPRWSPAS